MNMGNFEFEIRLTTERREGGQWEGGPNGDFPQSLLRISSATSPVPNRNLFKALVV